MILIRGEESQQTQLQMMMLQKEDYGPMIETIMKVARRTRTRRRRRRVRTKAVSLGHGMMLSDFATLERLQMNFLR